MFLAMNVPANTNQACAIYPGFGSGFGPVFGNASTPIMFGTSSAWRNDNNADAVAELENG